MLYTIPNLLTMFRIAVVPVLIVLFFINTETSFWAALVIYGVAAITDFFDGKIARMYGQTSAFGQFLDPIADKLLVIIVLFLLVAFDRLEGLWILPAIIIIIREILVSGLREFLGPYDVKVPVTNIAKWKTTSQMFCLGFIMIGDYGVAVLPPSMIIGQTLLIIATVLTVMSGWGYMKVGYKTIKELDSKKK